MKILFLDQSGKLGGAELSLLDVVKPYKANCLVGLFADGAFKDLLEEHHIPVQILTNQVIPVQKSGNLIQGLSSLGSLVPLITQIAKIARHYELIYANTQKALVVGAIASYFSRRPLVYHLRDILSADHFSFTNRKVAVTLANQFAALVIANSRATQAAFVEAGGHLTRTAVVYNGFQPESYQVSEQKIAQIKQQLGWHDRFVVGHFSRLSPWKGQHILIEALANCTEDVVAVLVGEALFGEQAYVEQLHRQVATLGLETRIKFLGFRSDIPPLMATCNLIAHTSTAPEPFGRVIIEGMLSGCPVIAAEAGGTVELIRHGKTGWLCPPNQPQKLAELIMTCRNQPVEANTIAQAAQTEAADKFHVTTINHQIAQLLDRL